MKHHQTVPAAGEKREKLRQKGQFWTPMWLAEVMARWVLETEPQCLFDPAVGPGTFFSAARHVGFRGDFSGCELHPEVFAEGEKLGLPLDEFRHVQIGDFLSSKVAPKSAIISNPPYIRHHRLSPEYKVKLRCYSLDELGFPLDGRTGLHVFFFVRCLQLLADGGRLAFLLPADVCEGVSSSRLWSVIARRYRINAVLTFRPEAAPFPRVDTNAIVFFCSKLAPLQHVRWISSGSRDPAVLWNALTANLPDIPNDGLAIYDRDVSEAVRTGLSRPPINPCDGLPLSAFAKVVRGIATGENAFFLKTLEQLQSLGIGQEFFQRAIARTRDCNTDVLEPLHLDELEQKGRPTWLLKLGHQSMDDLPESLRIYLEKGVADGLPQKALIKTRRPWYRMEHRDPPPILFSYLGRRRCRFILNRAHVVPLTGFLCVYPRDGVEARPLFEALNDPTTISNLALVGKSYGDGAIKVEPRKLSDLQIPLAVLHRCGLEVTNNALELLALD